MDKIKKIEKVYDGFSMDLLSNGRKMNWPTDKGYWAVSPIVDLFELFQKTHLKKHKKFIDLGSGDGRATIIANLFTDATGIEFDKELHRIAKRLAKDLNSNAKFINDDYCGVDLGSYDYIFMFPDSPFEENVENKLLKEMKSNSKLVVWGPLFIPEKLKQTKFLEIKGTVVTVYQNKV